MHQSRVLRTLDWQIASRLASALCMTFGVQDMKRRTVFGVIGFSLVGLAFASFIAHVLWQVKSGHGGDTYYNYKYQPMTYWGVLGTMGIMVLVGLVGLYYRAKRALEDRRARKVTRQ